MNLGEAYDELHERGFDYLAPSRMALMLNDAKNSFEDAWEFPWLEVVLQGTAPLIIPDLKYVVVVKHGAEELAGADVRQIALGGNDLTRAGAPESWYLADQVGDQVTMRVWPVPAQPVAVPPPDPPPDPPEPEPAPVTVGLTVIYIRRSPELSAVTDTPLIPARYHSLWLDLAVVEAYHDSDNFAGAQALRADINARLQTVIEGYETRNRQHSLPMTVRGYSEDD